MFSEIQPLIKCLALVLSGATFGFYIAYRELTTAYKKLIENDENIVVEDLGDGYYKLKCKKVSVDCSNCKRKIPIKMDSNGDLKFECEYCYQS